MSEWRETTLGEVINFTTGKLNSNAAVPDGEYPFFTCSPETLKIDGYSFDCKAILLAGNNANGIYSVKIYEGKFNAYQRTYVITSKDNLSVNLNYVYYLLNIKLNHFKDISQGSATKFLTAVILRDLHIFIPYFYEQKRIADVLSCLDAKIENLRSQNQTLEKIAQTLFDRWFIDFEFPNDSGEPYKSSGGAMIASELGDIPVGWWVGKLGDCLSLILDYRGRTPKKLGSDWVPEGIPALSAKNIKDGRIVREDAMNFVSQDLYKKWMKDELRKGDILLTSEAPLGEIYYLASNKKYVLSQRLFSLRATDNFSSPYLYLWLKSFQGQYLLNRRATGSTVEGIRQSELRKVEIIIPSEEVLNNATTLWSSLLEKLEINYQQIKTLTKTRDTLLPKLMSGQIRIPE